MVRNCLRLTATLIGAAFACGSVQAATLYDNGPYNGHSNAYNITSGNFATDSFMIKSSSTVNGVEFVAWDNVPSDTTVSVGWTIYSGLRQPYQSGNVIAYGTSLVANTFLLQNTQGYGVYSDTFVIPALALAAGNYSLALYNAVGSQASDQISWDVNNGPSTALVHTNFGPFESYQPSNSFKVLGSVAGVASVPEPASWALMIAGFGLVGAVVRRRSLAVVAA